MRNFFNAIANFFGSDPNGVDDNGISRLQRAVIKGDLDWVQSLVKSGADINFRGELLYPPLHLALERDRHAIALYLIGTGADLNLPDRLGKTPLHHAILQGQDNIVRTLLRLNADPNTVDSDGNTPLHSMATAHPDLISEMVKCNAKVNARDRMGRTPLHLFMQNISMAEELFKNGADPNIADHTRTTPFMKLLENETLLKDASILRQFLKHGADLRARNSNGETLLHRVIRLDMTHLFSDVLAKSDLSIKDYDGDTVLHAMLRRPDPKMMDEVLKRAPELLKVKNHDGRTPMESLIHRAGMSAFLTGYGRTESAALMLVSHGANINTADDDGMTLLHYAVRNYRYDFINSLATLGVDLDIKNKKGQSALHLAIDKNDMTMIDMLLDLGADPDLTDEKGWTLLDRLAEKGDRNSPVVQRLIVAGGDYKKQLPLNPELMRPHQRNGVKRPRLGGNKGAAPAP